MVVVEWWLWWSCGCGGVVVVVEWWLWWSGETLVVVVVGVVVVGW